MASKWALVYWLRARQYAIVKEEHVLDKLMLNDPYVVGKVQDADNNRRPPPGGWKKIDARVLGTGVSRLALERGAEALCEHYNCPLRVNKNPEENVTAERSAAELCQSVLTNEASDSSNGQNSDNTDNEGDETRADESAANPEGVGSSSVILQVLNHYLSTVVNEITEIRKEITDMKQSIKALTREMQSCRKDVSASGNEHIQNAIGEAERKLHDIIPGGERELVRILQAGGGSTTVLRKILEAAFSADELINSSLTGQNTERNALDPFKLGIIIEFMCLKFSDQTESTVKDYIRSKLRYKRRLAKQGEEPVPKKQSTGTIPANETSFTGLNFAEIIGRTRNTSARLSSGSSSNLNRESNQ